MEAVGITPPDASNHIITSTFTTSVVMNPRWEFCPKCGIKLQESWSFCAGCGTPIGCLLPMSGMVWYNSWKPLSTVSSPRC